MTTPAILGGDPVRKLPFPRHPVIGEAEKNAVAEVMESGELSSFLAVPGQYFNGGKKIKEFERLFAEYHGVKYAISFNSATAALHAAVVACGVGPGEEVIVPPYTFTATASCALMHNAIPVFADIQDDTYCLDPKSVAERITPLTKAIIPVHLFGHPASMDELLAVAHQHRLRVIEDCAQSPGARYKGRLCGTMGDCGIYSFTENKNITTGEGGMLITNDEQIAEVARLVRNHGEVVNPEAGARSYMSVTLGWNYRLTELQAALGIAQFLKMDDLNAGRQSNAAYLNDKLAGVPGLTPSIVYPDCTHVYYNYALKYDAKKAGLTRALFVKALAAEGIPFGAGYVPPLYWGHVYQSRELFPFQIYKGNASYERGICPVTEKLHLSDIVLTQVARPPATHKDMDDVVAGIEKVLNSARSIAENVAA